MDRQEIIATNKSLRLIKNELEHLLEKGVVNDDTFDNIMRILPNESTLSSAGTPAHRNAAAAIPSPAPSNQAPFSPPINSMANLGLGHNPIPSPAPPAYNATGPPSLPQRNNAPPLPPPSKPVIAQAKALYKYNAADDRDLSFEREDRILVHEYMNNDWWMGKNQRTGAEGIFPKNYVEIDHSEKAGFYAPQQPTYAPAQGGAYPGPPAQQNPYNSSVPPMAVAGDGKQGGEQSGGKGGEMGKKIGKKLGNAAIFGAGATLGGNLVNSIF
ncbi:SH3 domain-containing protein [Xylariales sp. AK1849]|nr:SH3 domain-containing protein [Xylariales sp. AK1849]